jgi:hypothetical protein
VPTLRVLGAASILLFLSGCASSIAYRADYITEKAVVANERIAGKVLVYTNKTDDEKLVTGGATSFTDGAAESNELTDSGCYRGVVRPQTEDFKYGFPQAKNLGLWITPQVEITLRMSILDASGKPLVEKDYTSGVIEGKGYMMSGQ